MTEDKWLMFRNRLTKVFRHLSRQAKRQGISCYRIYDHDLPEFPFSIEFYNDKLYVAEYKRRHNMTEEAHHDWMEKSIRVITEELPVKKENIFIKLRQRKPGRQGQYQKQDDELSPESANNFVVEENGLSFIVNLGTYLDTGLFLDHRITRQMVKQQSTGKKVLNLFAYTGSFSVYAAAGEAEEVITVDLSRTYLDRAAKNMTLNKFTDPAKYRVVQADVLQYLEGIQPNYFDLIILDPPTFSNSKKMENFLDIQRDHAGLINKCMKGMKKGALLYFSTNFRKFVLEEEKIPATAIRDITKATTPFDFAEKLSRKCYVITK